MRLLDRFASLILLLIWISATAAAIFVIWSPTNYIWLLDYFPYSEDHINDRLLWQILVGLVLLFIVEVWLLVRLMVPRGKGQEAAAVVHSTEVGDIYISLETIRTVCLRIGHQIRGVRELYVRVKHNNQQGSIVQINLKVIVDGERPIKDLTEELQIVLKAKVEQICGVSVDKVAVYVVKANQKLYSKQR